MSFIKPTITEQLFINFFKLEPDRPYYYLGLYRVARNIFTSFDMEDKIEEMQNMIFETMEQPLRADFLAINMAYYNMRFMMRDYAYTKIGDGVDYIEIRRIDMTRMFEKVKDWIMTKIILLSHEVRFTKPTEIYT